MQQSFRVQNMSVPLFKIFLLLMLICTPALNADAKWWIFGQADEAGVSTRYIYLNDLSYDELGEKITLYQESLPQGKVVIRGKGSAGKNKVGAVQVSLDGKQSWQKAKVTSNGSFLYSFTPELGKTYELYVKVLDTTGKSNDVDASRKELLISDESIQNQVYATLDLLLKAYMEEDSFAFMRQVSDDFVSGTALLDSAIRQDFTAFDNISINYTLNNVTQASDGNLFVAISFSRMVTSSRTGASFSDKASTEFTFKLENGVPKIYSMKNPLIFGLSDVSNIATGTVNSGENNQVLTVDANGTVTTTPISEIGSDSSSSAPAETGSFSLTFENDGDPREAFVFASQTTVNSWDPNDLYLEINLLWTNSSGGTAYEIGTVSLDSVTSVSNNPADYTLTSISSVDSIGKAFALHLGSGKYAVIRITNFTWIDMMAPDTRVDIEYKYQPDGSTNF